MHKKRLALAALVGALVAGCATQQAPEPAKPAAAAAEAKPEPKLMMGADAAMLSNTCAGCHGTDGISNGPATPTIAGMSETYFVEVMKAYQSGDRFSTVMQRMAKGYTEDEIKVMAKLYSGMPYKGKAQGKVTAQAKAGHKLHEEYCEKCHEEGGRSVEDDSGLLAGQWKPYIHWTLDDFVAGRSKPSEKKMTQAIEKMLAGHGPNSVADLAAFYASQK